MRLKAAAETDLVEVAINVVVIWFGRFGVVLRRATGVSKPDVFRPVHNYFTEKEKNFSGIFLANPGPGG
jgi:hypothetical protein